jgi:hypothetical protein
MMDQDQDRDHDQDPGKPGAERVADEVADVEGHVDHTRRAVEDEDDVEGHFGSIRPTGSKGE